VTAPPEEMAGLRSGGIARPPAAKPTPEGILANLLFLLAAFPYVSIIPLSSDLQPYTLLLAVVLAAAFLMNPGRPLRLPRPVWVLGLLLFYAGFVYLARSEPRYGLRSMAGYASVFFITVAAYKAFPRLKTGTFLFAVSVWAAVGALQVFYRKDFAASLLARMATSSVRGVTSLAVEPSYYAFTCMFFLVLNALLYRRGRYGRRLYHALNVLLYAQIFITYSGMGLVFFALLFATRAVEMLVTKSGIKAVAKLAAAGLVFTGLVFLFFRVPSFQNTRAGVILRRAAANPLVLVFLDASISDRATHIVLSFYSLSYTRGLGLGLGTWTDHVEELAGAAGGWAERLALANRVSTEAGRIMSGWGAAAYELGAVGLVYIVLVWALILKTARGPGDRPARISRAANLSLLFVMILAAVPLATPLFGFLLGANYYAAYEERPPAANRPGEFGGSP
jgi:hypothetical protein